MKAGNNKGNVIVGIIIIIAIIWGLSFLFSGDESSDSYESWSYNSGGNIYDYDDNDYQEPENPYNEGSGHSAGYEWAEENDVDSCGGNSNSFIEGCEEYLEQKELSEY